jgi:hypothetical protein
VSDLHLLDFLSADHQNLLEAEPARWVVDVSEHLSVERDFLYPAISHHAADGDAIVEDLRHAERELEECLKDLEENATPEHQARLRAAMQKHVTSQEELFTRLRALIPESALLTPAEAIAFSIGGSPTHAHPHLAEAGFLGNVIEDVTSAADHVLDRLHSRKHREGG